MSFYRDQLEKYLSGLDVKADFVLDLGGGQRPVKSRTKSWLVKEYRIEDLPAFDIEQDHKFPKQADAVFCLEVFEYVIEPVTALRNVKNALAPGGFAVVTFPLVYPVHNEVELDSLRFTESGIRRMAKKVGLTVKKVTYRAARTPTLVRYYSEDGMKAARGRDHAVTGYIVEFTH